MRRIESLVKEDVRRLWMKSRMHTMLIIRREGEEEDNCKFIGLKIMNASFKNFEGKLRTEI